MSSASKVGLLATAAVVIAASVAAIAVRHQGPPAPVHLAAPPMTVRELAPDPGALRVCADPNNLPFSDAGGAGFENAIAGVMARDLGKTVTYYWLPQRRGFVRNSLNAGLCDVIIGVPAHYELVRTTRAYYRSSYVFVARGRPLRSLDDGRLRQLTIGIQITGDDYNNPPPAAALAARHLATQVRGYPVYGDYSQPAPQRTIIDDVKRGRLDTAIVWGPLAGYFAAKEQPTLHIAPVTPVRDAAAGPFTFAIAMGVRPDDVALQAALNRGLVRHGREIRAILERFHVPLVDDPPLDTAALDTAAVGTAAIGTAAIGTAAVGAAAAPAVEPDGVPLAAPAHAIGGTRMGGAERARGGGGS